MASTLFQQVLHPDSRPHPWDRYAELRKEAVCQQDDGTYVVSRYEDVKVLLSDPRISSDVSKAAPGTRLTANMTATKSPTFIIRDNPEHDRLRGLTMRHFGSPARPSGVEEYRPMVERLVQERLDNLIGRTEFDLVEEFSHPIPVRMICHLMGIPLEEGATILTPLLTTVELEFLIDPFDPEPTKVRKRNQEKAIAYCPTRPDGGPDRGPRAEPAPGQPAPAPGPAALLRLARSARPVGPATRGGRGPARLTARRTVHGRSLLRGRRRHPTTTNSPVYGPLPPPPDEHRADVQRATAENAEHRDEPAECQDDHRWQSDEHRHRKAVAQRTATGADPAPRGAVGSARQGLAPRGNLDQD